MSKIKIEEVALESGVSNKVALEKAKELGFKVRARNSTINEKEAEALMQYILTGKVPEGFAKEKTEKKKETQKSIKEEAKVKVEVKEESKKEEENKKEEPKKEPKKRAGITTIPKEQSVKKEVKEEPKKEQKPKRKLGGITIVKKKNPKPEPKLEEKKEERKLQTQSPKKKKKKTPAPAKESGQKLEILSDRDLGGSAEVFEEQEVVLLDFSDKIIDCCEWSNTVLFTLTG